MKVYLHSDFQEKIKQSGVGRALYHQQAALEKEHIPYTLTDTKDWDVVHINTIFPNSYYLAKKARRQGKAVVYHAHSTAEDFKDSFRYSNTVAPLFRKWLEKCYGTADLLLTPTEYSKSLLQSYGLHAPIESISNGIDLNFWHATDYEMKKFRAFYVLDENRPLIISVGLQIKRKGLFDFIELARRLPEVQFIWFGYTDPKVLDEQTRQALSTRLENLRFAGYVDREIVRVAYQVADLYLFPTYEETEGIVLLEALASRIPTIVRDLPVFDDYEANKHLYKFKDLADLEQTIIGILNQELPDLTQAGYAKVSEKSIGKIGHQLRSCYQRALKIAQERR
ncbi:glycosyltransferase family 4 protein [Allofustis seminis]|uniref:glycosyltransferase family 4 protein n=1 Tax=Allofustis seminis TaxID=166939 RepID=UPI00036B2F85|nr:glycosyltransferase family 4 protein [Allofustis seminis]